MQPLTGRISLSSMALKDRFTHQVAYLLIHHAYRYGIEFELYAFICPHTKLLLVPRSIHNAYFYIHLQFRTVQGKIKLFTYILYIFKMFQLAGLK